LFTGFRIDILFFTDMTDSDFFSVGKDVVIYSNRTAIALRNMSAMMTDNS